jgi:DNA-binding transcriptional MerR regulator
VRPRDGEAMYSVTQLGNELGITARAIRFYEDKGLLSPARAGTTRVYTQRDRARMILILRGKRLGFSLKEIKEYLDLYDADPRQAAQNKVLLRGVQARIRLLEEQRQALDQTLDELREIERETVKALAELEGPST